MTDRVPHDHPTVETLPATVERDGPTRRPIVAIESTLSVKPDAVVRLVLDGTEYRARFEGTESKRTIRHAASTPRLARNPSEADNALRKWLESRDLPVGRSVHIDVVEPGFRYGLRAPGGTAVYESGRPDDTLADIARGLENRDDRSD